MSFENFKHAVEQQFDRIVNNSTELFHVRVDTDELWEFYLNSFPVGSNPIFRERTVNNCTSCRKFITRAGHIIGIIDGEIETLWDVEVINEEEGSYQVVANAMSDRIRHLSIDGIFRSTQETLGSKTNEEELENGMVNIYHHFHYILPQEFVTEDVNQFRSFTQTNRDVLERSLEEITLDAGVRVLDLIEENQIYRGTEHKETVEAFVDVRREWENIPKGERNRFLWLKSNELGAVARFRNTVIGSLLLDISSGTDIVDAVGKFEDRVAPENYKRSSALITQDMIDRAEEKVNELGIEKSLYRRFARSDDITSNNVLFEDRGTAPKEEEERSGIFADLEPTKDTLHPDNITKVHMEEFVTEILPHIDSMEVMVENTHINNFMSVIAPENRRSPNIMKWNNPFSWSYNGEVTDSIRERVKKAGGDVEGYMRYSLSWRNYNDLDIHAIEPSGFRIYYNNKSSPSGGEQDVDMNISPDTLEPVENIVWKREHNLQEGVYEFKVKNFNKRNDDNFGFEVEFQVGDEIHHYSYNKPLRHKEMVDVVKFRYTPRQGISIIESLPETNTSREVWNIETHTWSKVSMLMLSPNFWHGERIGNKHWFFILEDCLNPNKARGFYNEFLMNDLHDHRKVFEVLSSKMKAEPSDDQLSGVGFSSTRDNHLICKVSGKEGKYNRVIEIIFANDTGREFSRQKAEELTGETVGRCEVCKRDVTDVQSRLTCPNDCGNVFHTSHFIEHIRIREICPVCREDVTQRQIDRIVQLETVRVRNY